VGGERQVAGGNALWLTPIRERRVRYVHANPRLLVPSAIERIAVLRAGGMPLRSGAAEGPVVRQPYVQYVGALVIEGPGRKRLPLLQDQCPAVAVDGHSRLDEEVVLLGNHLKTADDPPGVMGDVMAAEHLQVIGLLIGEVHGAQPLSFVVVNASNATLAHVYRSPPCSQPRDRWIEIFRSADV
jgi:hypothetical protein